MKGPGENFVTYVCPYIEPPTIPEGMTCAEYRINRPSAKVSTIRRLLRSTRR